MSVSLRMYGEDGTAHFTKMFSYVKVSHVAGDLLLFMRKVFLYLRPELRTGHLCQKTVFARQYTFAQLFLSSFVFTYLADWAGVTSPVDNTLT